jgi:hypothetical protein
MECRVFYKHSAPDRAASPFDSREERSVRWVSASSPQGTDIGSPGSCGGEVIAVTRRATRGEKQKRGTDPERVVQGPGELIGRNVRVRALYWINARGFHPRLSIGVPFGERN